MATRHDESRHYCRLPRRAEAAGRQLAAQHPERHSLLGAAERRRRMDRGLRRRRLQSAATRILPFRDGGSPINFVFSVGFWVRAASADIPPGSAHSAAGVIDVSTGERFNCDAGVEDLWLATSPKVADEAEKRRLATAYGAALVDMEAAAIARLAAMHLEHSVLLHQGSE